MKNVWVKEFIQEDSCLGCDTTEAFAEALKTLGQTSYSLGQAVSLSHHDVETAEKDDEGNPLRMTIWHMPKTPADLLWAGYRNGIDSAGYNSNPGLTVEGTKIAYTTGRGTQFEIAPCWGGTNGYYAYVCGWRLTIYTNPGGTLEAACRENGFEKKGGIMKYEKLARTKSHAYTAAVEKMKRYAEEAGDVAELGSSEKLDALYKIERALKRALKAAQEQREMEQRYNDDVVWTIDEVVSLCRDMDGACEECPLWNAREQRCFRAKDNGIAGASTPASWNVSFSPLLEGTPAGDWIERFRDTHACECCPGNGGHCDITGDHLPGRCNCRMTRVPGEWQ